MSTNSNEGMAFTRRQALAGIAVGGATAAALGRDGRGAGANALGGVRDDDAHQDAAARPPAFAGQHAMVPLPFDAAKLNGISAKLITSHHENNYGAAVKNLNKVEGELAKVAADTAPFLVAGLRERELMFRNSKTLHEAYFANLGGNGKRSGAIEAALGTAYGSLTTWETHFRATGMSLGGGSGWVILSWELFTGSMRTAWSGNHTQVLASSVPLLVMDMYEHAYQMDFGAGHAKYIDTFFTNVNWDEVNARLERAQRASAALR